MIHSMTAFARSEHADEHGTLSWEIRSVNHRYLEPHIRLPESFRELETPVRDLLRKGLSRGKLECTLRFVEAQQYQSLHIDSARAAQIITAAENLAELTDRPAPINPLELLAWPGVMISKSADAQALNMTALQLFQQALEVLKTDRAREGLDLAGLISERLDSMSQDLSSLRDLLPEMLEHQRRRILERCADWGVELDPGRLEQEMVLLAQKTDVAEELDRLTTHIAEVRRILKTPGASGRRLDFLMQELNREANTLGSKAFDARTTQVAINLKVLIEQMREQVQNIE
ncbi:uncharacterized protein (TIGR00255 family) [Azomonas agilis]|uniref:Uncharacterized protein (TIGR00255 family) n=1 Tax=Azomonas agilis TaxID=116849 RepID=A0A562IKD2_9GAMM|nr:YicC/YloC family endoribonuclease [Azomonas agilis]TWH71477.1 uncharacterized protein (TIGR00255 family) [Azomonas agilis]